VVVLGSGEASGPLYPPAVIDEEMFSCEDAAEYAFEEAQIGTLSCSCCSDACLWIPAADSRCQGRGRSTFSGCTTVSRSV
jgi:hypothetical protein